MMPTEDDQITYDLEPYKQTLSEWADKPELYLKKYFSQHTFTYQCANGKRKHDEIVDTPLQSINLNSEPRKQEIAVESELAVAESESVYMAPNKLCVVGVGEDHPLLVDSVRSQVGNITKIEFSEMIKNSEIKGKGKKNAARVHYDTKICTVYTDTGREYVFRAAITGQVIEWNRNLIEDPSLVQSRRDLGFFVIIKPPKPVDDKILSQCT